MVATLPEQRFRALADPTRLRLLALLREDESCVGDLVQVLDLPQGTVSRHLGTLREAGLVEARRAGAWAFYRRAEVCDAKRPLGKVLEEAVVELPECQRDAERMEQLKREGGCC